MSIDLPTHCPICQDTLRLTNDIFGFDCPTDQMHLWCYYRENNVSKGLSAINIRYNGYQLHWMMHEYVPFCTRIWKLDGSSHFSNPLVEIPFLMDIPSNKEALETRLRTLLTFM